MADTAELTAMLKHLGWGSGFKLPIANDENRELEKILEMKQSRLLALNTEFQETSLAVENSTSFMRNLKSKIQHLKDVEGAKRSQMDKEKHFHFLAEKDNAKINADLKLLHKRLHSLKHRNKNLECNILRRKDVLGELVDTINFDKKAISAYENKFNEEDAYMRLIEDFAETDKDKYEQCKKDYQLLGETIVNSRRDLNQAISESEVLEGELEGLAKRFRKAHTERNQFIENWKGTLEALEARDQEIMEMSYEYKKSALRLRKSSDILYKQEAFYENVKNQSRSYRSELNRIKRMMGTLHLRKKDTESASDDIADAIAEIAGLIFKMEKEIKFLTKQYNSLSLDTDIWTAKFDKAKGELDSLRSKYDLFAMQSMTSAEHVKQLEEFLDNEERKGEALQKELMKQTTFKCQRDTQINDLNNDILLSEAQARNLKASIGSAQRQSAETGDVIVKTKSVAYGLDIQIMNLVGKVRTLENPELAYSRDEYASLAKTISDLKGAYRQLLKNEGILRTQANHCDNVITICHKEIVKEGEEHEKFERGLQILGLQIRRVAKEDDAALEEIKDILVTNSLLHVQLSKMLHSIQDYEEKLFGLEQERVTLHTVVKGRKKDIETHYTLLQGKKRALMEECQKLKQKVHEVSGEAASRKRKYEMIMMQMWSATASAQNDAAKEGGSSPDEKGRSEAYYIIKIAQEREHYRQEGDKWDDRVKEAEKVVEGLQNTLALMIGTNEAFKDSLKPAIGDTTEGKQLEELKAKQYVAAHDLKRMKEKKKECLLILKDKQLLLDEALSEKNQLDVGLREKQYELQNLIIEITGQKEKIRRATQQANKLIKELSKIESLDTELLQNDLRLRVTKEKYEFACSTLERLLSIYPYLLERTMELLDDKGMTMLKDKLYKKMISLSFTGTPHHSGLSSPTSDRSGRGSNLSMSAAMRLKPGSPGSERSSILSTQLSRTTQKSIVFSTLTGAPSYQKVLGNITKGMQEAKKRRTEKAQGLSKGTGARSPTAQSLSTTIKEEEEPAANGISFGALRKALQDAVDDEKKGSKASKLSPSPRPTFEPPLEEEDSAMGVVELVDNKEKFKDSASPRATEF